MAIAAIAVATRAFGAPVALSAPLPANLQVPAFYRSIVETMWQHSPTFRRQCSRIASVTSLTVVLQAGTPAAGTRASTRIVTKPDGRRLASVRVGDLDDPIELIAHELEHIVEQLDGADLAALAAHSVSGVRSIDGGFETVRAIRTGEKVAREVRGDAR